MLQGYDNSESRVRKASVFCLVAVYLVVGDELRPHLSKLSGSKVCPTLSLRDFLPPFFTLHVLLCAVIVDILFMKLFQASVWLTILLYRAYVYDFEVENLVI